jgi:lipopolysaccharide heptosyltransferase II
MTRTPRQRLRLTLLRTFAHLHPPISNIQSLRILVIRPDHLGDLLLTTPVLRLLRQRYPQAHITALLGPWGAPVLAHNPHVDEIITLPFPGFARGPKPSPWQPYGLLRHWARRLRGQYDLALILRFDHWWGAWLAHLAGVPWRVGYAVPEVAPFVSHAVPYRVGRHEVEQNLVLGIRDWVLGTGESLDESYSPVDFPLEFYVSRQAEKWANAFLHSGEGVSPIAVHPGAGAAVKLWRVEGWAAVADALAQETGAPVLLTGSQAEQTLCGEIARRMKTSAQVMAGQTTLDQLAALFARCQLVLGPDSGPLHLAVAVGAPTVHLYGPVDKATFGPWGAPERHRVSTSAWPCVPCNRLDYGPDELAHHPCVREIRVEQVLDAARQVLATANTSKF